MASGGERMDYAFHHRLPLWCGKAERPCAVFICRPQADDPRRATLPPATIIGEDHDVLIGVELADAWHALLGLFRGVTDEFHAHGFFLPLQPEPEGRAQTAVRIVKNRECVHGRESGLISEQSFRWLRRVVPFFPMSRVFWCV